MNDIPAYLIPVVFFGIVCAAFAIPFFILGVARIIRSGNRHLDR